jgi:hypothetical protein
VVQIVQILGAVAILVAFPAQRFGLTGQRSWSFLGLNLAGSVVLAVAAYAEEQWGFLLLEVVWALVSAWGLWARTAGRGDTLPA